MSGFVKPTQPDTFVRLTRILLVEWGDEDAAPDGWEYAMLTWFHPSRPGVAVGRCIAGPGWFVEVLNGGTYRMLPSDDEPLIWRSALEAIEAVEAMSSQRKRSNNG